MAACCNSFFIATCWRIWLKSSCSDVFCRVFGLVKRAHYSIWLCDEQIFQITKMTRISTYTPQDSLLYVKQKLILTILYKVYIERNHHHHHQKIFAVIKKIQKCQLSFFYLDFSGSMQSSSSCVPAFYVHISLESNTSL